MKRPALPPAHEIPLAYILGPNENFCKKKARPHNRKFQQSSQQKNLLKSAKTQLFQLYLA